jgi:hypothetical protein
MGAAEVVERLHEAVVNRTFDPDVERALTSAETDWPVVWLDGKWRLGGFIAYFQEQWRLLRAIDSSLPFALPRHLLDQAQVARFFSIPLEEFGSASDEPLALARIESKLDTLLKGGAEPRQEQPSSPPATAPADRRDANSPVRAFRRDGPTWYVEFAYAGAMESGYIPGGLDGFELFRFLLQHPDHPFDALDVESGAGVPHATGKSHSYTEDEAATHEGDVRAGDSREKAIDAPGLEKIKQEIARLERELDDTVNPEREEELRQQIQSIKDDHVRRLLNRRGQPRSIGAIPDAERARKRVNNKLARTRQQLEKHGMKNLAKYLEQTVVGVGTTFMYLPGKAIMS